LKADAESFTRFVEEVAHTLRQALIARYGVEAGDDATSEALAYAWQNWDRMMELSNVAGYLYRVGQTRARQRLRRRFPPIAPALPQTMTTWFEPGLAAAMGSLSPKQRAAIVLVHGFDWTATEVAEVWGVSFSTVQTHLDRGMAKLRRKLGVRL
jgi:RNA polymerase sigma factor (sigma-70 family)